MRQGWSAYYCNTEFVILVIDSTDRDRIHLSKEELWKLLNNEELARASILIYANKQDVAGCMTAAEVSSELNLTAIKQHKWQIQACVALTGQGLYQGERVRHDHRAKSNSSKVTSPCHFSND